MSGPEMLSDLELVERAKASDEEAFSELVRRYERKIFNLALSISGNREDAADILQDTFLQVLKKLDTFESRAKFSTWLYRVATNVALMKKRKDKKYKSISLDQPFTTEKGSELKMQLKDDWSSRPFNALERKELGDEMRRLIEELPDEYRIPLVLRDIRGLSNEDTARQLELSLPAVKSRVHRARMYLRDKLSGYIEPEEPEDGHN